MMNEKLNKLQKLNDRLSEIEKKVHQIFGIEDLETWVVSKTPSELYSFVRDYSGFPASDEIAFYANEKLDQMVLDHGLTYEELRNEYVFDDQVFFKGLILHSLSSEKLRISEAIQNIQDTTSAGNSE